MNNIYITVYTKESGRFDLTYKEYINFDFDKVICHRIDGPASIWYYKDGSVWRESYYIHNQSHRIDDPAVIWYHSNGSILDTRYYINDKCYIKEEYDNLINEMKALPKSLKLVHEDWWVREL